mgnify:CR=1 FL=1
MFFKKGELTFVSKITIVITKNIQLKVGKLVFID